MTEYLSLRKAAKQLGVHHATLSRAVKRGELSPEYRTPGGFMRFTEAEVERFRYERLKYNGKSGLTELGPDLFSPRYSAGLPDNVNRILESIPELAVKSSDSSLRVCPRSSERKSESYQ